MSKLLASFDNAIYSQTDIVAQPQHIPQSTLSELIIGLLLIHHLNLIHYSHHQYVKSANHRHWRKRSDIVSQVLVSSTYGNSHHYLQALCD